MWEKYTLEAMRSNQPLFIELVDHKLLMVNQLLTNYVIFIKLSNSLTDWTNILNKQ
jgi:hypothetical protein